MSDSQRTQFDVEAQDTVASSSPEHRVGFIRRILSYMTLNNAVQSTTKKIQHRYDSILTLSKQQINGLKKTGEEILMSTTERIKTWCYDITIYNHLIGMWLVQNLPDLYENQQIVSYEEFAESFHNLVKDDSEELEKTIKNLYDRAATEWKKLSKPGLDDIKKACLIISARAIADDYEIAEEEFPTALVEFFSVIDTKKIDNVTEEAFYLHVRRHLTNKPSNEFTLRRAAAVFYIFAKRFAYLEFPLTYANQDILRVLAKFAKEKFDITGEILLTRVDKMLNYLMKSLGIEQEEQVEPLSLLDRLHLLVQKLRMIAWGCYNKTWFAIQDSKGYKLSDKYVHYEKRYEDLIAVAQQIVKITSTVLSPAYEAITYTYDHVAKKYIVALYDVSSTILKEKYSTLKEKYSILKEATIKLKDHVLEIEISKEAFERMGKNVKAQISLLYEEIRKMDYKKLKFYGSQAYFKALETIKHRAKEVETSESAKSNATIKEGSANPEGSHIEIKC